MKYTRRDAAKLALASIPAVRALAAPNSRINGVQIGVITYSFRPLEDIDQLVRTIAQLGISEVELMSNAVEVFAGATGAGFGARGGTPQEQAARAEAAVILVERVAAGHDGLVVGERGQVVIGRKQGERQPDLPGEQKCKQQQPRPVIAGPRRRVALRPRRRGSFHEGRMVPAGGCEGKAGWWWAARTATAVFIGKATMSATPR